MTKRALVTTTLVFALFTGVSLSEEATPKRKVVSEETVRAASVRAYSDLLCLAYSNGWRYAPDRVENGFKRHLEELRAKVASQGYVIEPCAADAFRRPVRECLAEPIGQWPGTAIDPLAKELMLGKRRDIRLGHVTGVLYYTVEPEGYRITATLVSGAADQSIKFIAMLGRRQRIVISVPRSATEPFRELEILRDGDSVIINHPVNGLPGFEDEGPIPETASK
jgi:hypothetical protein